MSERGRGNGRGTTRGGNRGRSRGRGRGRDRAGERAPLKYPIGAGKIQEALDDPSADLGALVSSPGFVKLLSLDSMTGEAKIYGQFKKTLDLILRLFEQLPSTTAESALLAISKSALFGKVLVPHLMTNHGLEQLKNEIRKILKICLSYIENFCISNSVDIEWVNNLCNNMTSYHFRSENPDFETKAIEVLDRQKEIRANHQAQENDPDHIKKKSIYPTVKDLLKDSREINVEAWSLIVEGQYESIEDYAKRLFILTKEDFMRPLRDGIKAYLGNKKIENSINYKRDPDKRKWKQLKRITEIRIFEAEPLGASKARNNSGSNFKLHFTSKKKINWEKAKCLMHGSLLILTCDTFSSDENLVLGIVAGTDNVKNGILEITIIQGDLKPATKYVMIESTAFFLPVKNVLERLQADDFNKIPFQNILVKGSDGRLDRTPGYPAYLTNQNIVYKMDSLFARKQVNLYVCEKYWPHETSMIVKEEQLRAIKAALQKSVSVIQGPPGTGKTFIAKLAMRCLLENSEHWYGKQRTPILLICYTNHALDQFIEGILEFEDSIVRYGGRTKSERVAHYTIHEQRKRQNRSNFNKSLWIQVKRAEEELSIVQERRRAIEKEFDLAFTDVISPEKLYFADVITQEQYELIIREVQDRIYPQTFDYLSQPTNGEEPKSQALNLMKVWLEVDYLDQLHDANFVKFLNRLENYVEEQFYEDEDAENIERMSYEHIEDQKAKLRAFKFHEKRIRDEIKGHIFSQPSMKQHEQSQLQQWRNNWNPKNKNDDCEQAFNDHFNEKYTKLGEKWIRKLRREEKQVIEDAYQNYDKSKTAEQLWNEASRGDVNRRRIWYGSAIEKYQMRMVTKLQDSDEQLKFASEALQNFRILQDTDICKRFRLVAMTTTIATKNFRLIQNLGCKIIMAEESAELPESHLVACLTEHTQQMILIGDHQQLRPKVNCYELEKKCNLDISLFERLIKNEFEFVRLGEQHRMQPNISSFMSNCFYNNLKDSVRTVNREEDSVIYLGDDGRVQFINYGSIAKQRPEFFEASDSDGTSKSNKMEAEYVVLIAQQLINSGYKAENITILTLYIGQLFAIREKVRTQLPRSSQPDIQTVDNYQGQENQVVILSTVRSNKEMNGGFATTSNRCCVALSRAKSALFVVGNLEMLRNAQGGAHKNDGKNVWVQIMKHAQDKNVVSEGLRLECPWHPDYKVLIPYVREMEFKKKVKEAFPQGGCPDPCSMIFECGHPCPKTCHDPKEHEGFKCTVIVNKQLPCGHKATIQCHIKPADYLCKKRCERKIASCGHDCTLKCHEKCTSKKCKELVQKTCSVCSNIVTKECRYKKELENPCEQRCMFELKDCGHNCDKACHSEEVHKNDPCLEPCQDFLPCGHLCPLLCKDHTSSDTHEKFQCEKKCERACKKCNGKSCKDKCFEDCKTCVLPVQKALPCSHWKKVACNISAEEVKCETKCKRKLSCGHNCKLLCWQDCKSGKCLQIVEKSLPCGHKGNVPCHMQAEDFLCKKKCEKKYEACGHSCKQLCYESCDKMKCRILVTIERSCQHLIAVPCNGDYTLDRCEEDVETKLECFHTKKVKCFETEDFIRCDHLVNKILKCGHHARDLCHKEVEEIFCKKKIDRKLDCGHPRFDVECGKIMEELVQECKEPCLKKLSCGHMCNRKCNQKCDPKKCNEAVQKKCKDCDGFIKVECGSRKVLEKCKSACKIRLPCGHQCPQKCHEGEKFDHAKVICLKKCKKKCEQCGERTCKKLCFEKCQPCKTKNVMRILKCGHTGIGICSSDPVCNEKCTKKLNCGHLCKELCREPCTSVCTEKCLRKLGCEHECTKICSETCDTSCSQLVDQDCLTCAKRGLVGKVECRVRDAFFGASESCVSPCRSILECGHPCDGNCTDCFGGLFHKPCSKICEQAKVCGHICKDKCHKDCPPCEERCTKRCFHSVCDHACFEMCTPCSEPCPEPGCNLLCSDNCEHELAVAKRCRATRPCEHQCELISHNSAFDSFLHTKDHCAKCNESISEKFYSVIMLTEEYDEEELYVYLPDCQHRIEIEGLDGWVRSVAQETEFKAILCPKCKARMSSARYTKIFNKWNMKYENIKSKYRDAARRRREELNVAINSLTSEFERGSLSRRAMRARSVKDKYQLLAKAQFAVKFKKSFEKISDGLKNMIDPDKIFFHRIDQIASLTGNVEFSLDSQNQSKDILLKLNLFASWSEKMDNFGYRFSKIFSGNAPQQLEALVEISNKILFAKLEPEHQNVVERSKLILGAFTIVTSEEVEAVARAIAAAEHGMRGGHWFECPNGHPYFIGECGGAMENAVCPCGARIGGSQHRLVSNNNASAVGGGYDAFQRNYDLNPPPNPADFQ